MTSFFQQISEDSPTFRQALLKSEKKRILGIVLFVLFFVLLAAVRIFALGSAMSRWGLLTAAILIAFELGLFWAVNRALQSGKEVPQFAWYWTLTLESLFPASGVAFLSSTQLHVDYRPLATPWVLAYFPLILLSVLRLSPRLCCFSGFTSAFGYLTAAFFLGWRFNPKDGFTVTESAVPYFALLLATMGILAAMVASQIRSYVEAALREADTQHQLRRSTSSRSPDPFSSRFYQSSGRKFRGLRWQAGANRRMILAGIFTIGRDCPTASGQSSWPM